ncbi:MAG: hypothetical protein ACI9Q9_000445, partial [Flavobacterium sp.]
FLTLNSVFLRSRYMSTSIQVAYRKKKSKLLILCNFGIDVKGVFFKCLSKAKQKIIVEEKML